MIRGKVHLSNKREDQSALASLRSSVYQHSEGKNTLESLLKKSSMMYYYKEPNKPHVSE
jgi:hypothetical protein